MLAAMTENIVFTSVNIGLGASNFQTNQGRPALFGKNP